MIKKKLEKKISLTKDEFDLLCKKEIIIVKNKYFIFFYTKEEFKKRVMHLGEDLSTKEKRKLWRVFFSKAKQKKIVKRRFLIEEL